MIYSLPLANLIFGAFDLPFFLMMVFWFVVLLIEYPCVYLIQKRKVSILHTIWLVGTANVVSWLIGYNTIHLFPNYYGIEIDFGVYKPDQAYVIASFVVIIIAFFISWLIEYLFIRLFRRFFNFHRLGKAVGYANLITYLAIYILCFLRIITLIGK